MTRLFSSLVCCTALLVGYANAQEGGEVSVAALTLELNALHVSDTGCRVSFLATNEMAATLDRTAVEVAIFNTDGAIDRIVTLDFTALPQGKTKVLQFELQDLACTQIGRLLINDITACEGNGIEPEACLLGLTTTSRPDIAFGV